MKSTYGAGTCFEYDIREEDPAAYESFAVLQKERITMADTGLLITHTYNERGYLDNELYKAILLGNLGINEGMLTENVVAQLLVSNGCRLFYYRRGRNDPKGQMEVDFLIRRGLKICPVEVKSSDDSTHHPSLDSFRKIFRKGMGPSYVLHPKDVSRKDGIIYLPLYMAQFAGEQT